MKTLLATAAVSVLLLAACGTAGGTGATTVNENGRTVNAALTDNKIVLDQSTVPSGKITFNVKNTGHDGPRGRGAQDGRRRGQDRTEPG